MIYIAMAILAMGVPIGYFVFQAENPDRLRRNDEEP